MNRISANTLEIFEQINSKHCGPIKHLSEPDDLKKLLTKIEEGGDIYAIPGLLVFLLKMEKTRAFLIAESIDRLLKQIQIANLPLFDEQIRMVYRYASFLDARYLDWNKISPWQVPSMLDFDEFSSSLLGVLSFHNNGYVREAATLALATFKDGSEVPFLLLRVNDWVTVIRKVAHAALLYRCKREYAVHFTKNLPLIMRLERCDRADYSHLINSIVSQLEEEDSWKFLLAGIQSEDMKVRRAAFFLAIRTSNSKLCNQAIELGIRGQDSLIRFRSAQKVSLITNPNQLESLLPIMREDPFMPVRLAALKCSLDLSTENVVDILKDALLDKHISIREFARHHLDKIEPMDYGEYYRSVLRCQQQSGVYAAIAGLGETGVAQDDVLILPFVKHKFAKFRTAALRALAKLNLHQHTDTFLICLEDESPKVSREAARSLAKSRRYVSYQEEIWQLIARDSADHVKLNALNLLNKLPKWDSIYYILKSLNLGEDLLRERANDKLREWWSSYNRSFTMPKDYQKKRIREELNKYPFGDKTRVSLENIMQGL